MEAKKAFWKAMAKADDDIMKMSLLLGLLEVKRQGVDNWADVGSMNHIAEKLAEVRKELEMYSEFRLPEE